MNEMLYIRKQNIHIQTFPLRKIPWIRGTLSSSTHIVTINVFSEYNLKYYSFSLKQRLWNPH